MLAGLATGVWDNAAALADINPPQRTFEPAMSQESARSIAGGLAQSSRANTVGVSALFNSLYLFQIGKMDLGSFVLRINGEHIAVVLTGYRDIVFFVLQ